MSQVPPPPSGPSLPGQQPPSPPPPPPGPSVMPPVPGSFPATAPGYRPDHPRATTSLVLGIVGLVVCQILSPIALIMGKNAMREIDASGGQLGGRGSARAGWILGLIGTILLGVGLVVAVIGLLLVLITSRTTSSLGLLHQA